MLVRLLSDCSGHIAEEVDHKGRGSIGRIPQEDMAAS